jgi:multiple sugar transport system ATP-binding protein
MTLGDRVVVLNKGVVQQVDEPNHLYRHPVNTFVAGFIGSPAMNFLRGRIENGAVLVGSHRVDLPEAARSSIAGRSGDVVVGVRPEDFVPANGTADAINAKVAFSESLGPETLVHFRADDLELVERQEQVEAGEEEQATEFSELLVARFGAAPGTAANDELRLKISPQGVKLFEVTSGRALL